MFDALAEIGQCEFEGCRLPRRYVEFILFEIDANPVRERRRFFGWRADRLRSSLTGFRHLRFDGLGAGIEQHRSLVVVAGRERDEPLAHGYVFLVRRHHEARVGDLGDLLLRGIIDIQSATYDDPGSVPARARGCQ